MNGNAKAATNPYLKASEWEGWQPIPLVYVLAYGYYGKYRLLIMVVENWLECVIF